LFNSQAAPRSEGQGIGFELSLIRWTIFRSDNATPNKTLAARKSSFVEKCEWESLRPKQDSRKGDFAARERGEPTFQSSKFLLDIPEPRGKTWFPYQP